MDSTNRIIQCLSIFLAHTRIRINASRVSVILVMRYLPDWISRRISSLRVLSPLRTVLPALILMVAIISPTILYMVERNKRIESERAYEAYFFVSTNETRELQESLDTVLGERIQLQRLLLEAGYPVYDENGALMLKLLATGYSSSVAETDNTPYITASNTRTRTGVVALSRDLLKRYTTDAPFDFGDRIYIAGHGVFSVEDSMNPRWQKRIDIWFPSRTEAVYFGKKNVYVSKLMEEEDVVLLETHPLDRFQ